MDPHTPVNTLRLEDPRVCSDHFDRDDYCQAKRPRRAIMRFNIKKNAVPRAEKRAADRVERTDGGDDSPKESEFAAVPQSTPTKTRHKSNQRSGSTGRSLSSSLTLLTNPHQTIPRTKPSLSGAHLALPPTWAQSVVEDNRAIMDSPGQVRGTGIQVPGDCTAAEKKPTLHIVDEEAILQLMNNCPMCNRKCRCSKRTCGPYLIVYQKCYFCDYQRKWANQPEAANMNIYRPPKPAKRKPQPKNKVSVNAKTQSQLKKKSISESSVSESHDPTET
uniref:uncharacterized protein isoform X1 n=2 Tax=Semicossyphus pulcher TaxID=241346 RepID=UPI0037E8A724